MSDPVSVRLIGLPLGIYQRALDHSEELMREFALFALQPPPTDGDHGVPLRLLALVDELNARYATTTVEVDAQRDDAIARGESEVDLTYVVPREVREASVHLGAVLDEADVYCRAGQHLLTLETPPDAKAFRDWYLGEFIAQIDGRQPTPWPMWAAERGID